MIGHAEAGPASATERLCAVRRTAPSTRRYPCMATPCPSTPACKGSSVVCAFSVSVRTRLGLLPYPSILEAYCRIRISSPPGPWPTADTTPSSLSSWPSLSSSTPRGAQLLSPILRPRSQPMLSGIASKIVHLPFPLQTTVRYDGARRRRSCWSGIRAALLCQR